MNVLWNTSYMTVAELDVLLTKEEMVSRLLEITRILRNHTRNSIISDIPFFNCYVSLTEVNGFF